MQLFDCENIDSLDKGGETTRYKPMQPVGTTWRPTVHSLLGWLKKCIITLIDTLLTSVHWNLKVQQLSAPFSRLAFVIIIIIHATKFNLRTIMNRMSSCTLRMITPSPVSPQHLRFVTS